MTPQELAELHPHLFHVTTPGAWTSMERHGLLSADSLLDLFEIAPERRARLTTARRPAEQRIAHDEHGEAVLTDNLPLHEGKLAACLDDGLTPAEWLAMLNARVFFWVDLARVRTPLNARANRGRARSVLVFDTASLTAAHADRVELAPINTGATIRRAARRGRSTFTPLLAMSHREWRRRRGKLDHIAEVLVRDSVPDARDHFIGVWQDQRIVRP